jgi:hypothetical protein
MKTDTFTLPPHVVHVASYETLAVFYDLKTQRTFCVPLIGMTTERIRVAWLEARSEYEEENPAPRDSGPVCCFVAIITLLAVVAVALSVVYWASQYFNK